MGKENNSKAIPTQNEYITEQIEAKKQAALNKSLQRKMPKVPKGIKRGERWNPITKKVEDIYETGNSCAYTFADNYGLNFTSSEDFRQNHKKYGFKQINWENRKAGDGVLVIGDDNIAKHTMMYDSDNAEGQPLYNHSNGGSDEYAIRKKAKYPVSLNNKLTYTYVGTPTDSAQWINQYKQIYGMAKGGIFGVPYLKKGGIHIKEENKGKFTASAKAAGQSVQEHAKSVLNDPNATPLQKKRANFARNAKKWKHEEGAKIHKPNGHRAITDNGWIPTKRLKKGTYGLTNKWQRKDSV